MWSSLTTALEAGAEYSKKAVAEASVAASHAAAVAQQAAEQGAAVAQQAAASAAEEASKATGIAAATLSSMHTPEGSALLHQTVREFLALTGEGAADSATPAELVPLMRQRALTLIKAAESYREQANAMAERGKEYKAQYQQARDRLEMVGRAGQKMQASLAEQTARVAQLEQLVVSAGLALPPAPAATTPAAPAARAAEQEAEAAVATKAVVAEPKPAAAAEADVLVVSIEPSGESSLVVAIQAGQQPSAAPGAGQPADDKREARRDQADRDASGVLV